MPGGSSKQKIACPLLNPAESYVAFNGNGRRRGRGYPAGPETLAASVGGYPKIAGRLRRLKCCRVHQDGDDGELTVLFDLADFDKVAEIMRPHRKRQWTEEQKQQARERLAKYQYTPVVDRRLSGRTDVFSTGVV